MGMDANVIGAGPFSQDVVDILDYPAEYYKDTKEGTIVLVSIFLANTTDQSYELARALGVEAWDFNTHKIDPAKIDRDALVEFACGSVELSVSHVDAFFKLIEKGFIFIYRPNG